MFAVIILLIVLAVIAMTVVRDIENNRRTTQLPSRPRPYDHTQDPDGDPCGAFQEQEAINEEAAQEDAYQRRTKHESIMPPDY